MYSLKEKSLNVKTAQQSVPKEHRDNAPDAGALRVHKSQAVFYAFSFFWLDGFAVPALVVEPVETQRG